MTTDTVTLNLSVDITGDPSLMRPADYDLLMTITPNERAELTREMRRALGPVLHRLADERNKPFLPALDTVSVRNAFDNFTAATKSIAGPGLAMQKHTPTWEAWKALCNAIFPEKPRTCSSCGRKYSHSGVGNVCLMPDCQFSCRPSVEP